MFVICRFCNLHIEKSRVTSHYRKKHKPVDLARATVIAPRNSSANPRINPRLNSRVNPRVRTIINSIIDSVIENTVEQVAEHECMICFENHRTVVLPCNHRSTCHECLNRWWRQSFYSPRCPMCRTEVDSIRHNGQLDHHVIPSWFAWRRRSLNRGTSRRENRAPTFLI